MGAVVGCGEGAMVPRGGSAAVRVGFAVVPVVVWAAEVDVSGDFDGEGGGGGEEEEEGYQEKRGWEEHNAGVAVAWIGGEGRSSLWWIGGKLNVRGKRQREERKAIFIPEICAARQPSRSIRYLVPVDTEVEVESATFGTQNCTDGPRSEA